MSATTIQDIYVTLGRLLAVVEAVRPLNSAEFFNATSKAEWLIGRTLPMAMPKLRRRPELDELVAELMGKIDLADYDALPKVIPATSAGAGRMMLAYYQQRAHLPARVDKPRTPAGVDWSTADWSQSDQALAEQHGVSRQAAQAARKRHAPSHQ